MYYLSKILFLVSKWYFLAIFIMKKEGGKTIYFGGRSIGRQKFDVIAK